MTSIYSNKNVDYSELLNNLRYYDLRDLKWLIEVNIFNRTSNNSLNQFISELYELCSKKNFNVYYSQIKGLNSYSALLKESGRFKGYMCYNVFNFYNELIRPTRTELATANE